MMAQYRFRTVVIMVVFLAIISFPFLNARLGIMHDVKSSENRKMAKKPVLNLDSGDSFPMAYEQYYNDAFPFRASMIKSYNNYKLRFFGRSPFPDKVLVGDEGWLFAAGEEDACFRNVTPFSTEELEAFRLEMEYRTDYLAARGCAFYLLIAPIKAAIYPEYVSDVRPDSILTKGGQLAAYLAQHSRVKVLYPADRLRSLKSRRPLYYKLDTHWNHLGAFYTANEALKMINRDFPGIKPLNIRDYNITTMITKSGDLSKMLGDVDIFSDSIYNVIPKSGFRTSEVEEVGYPIPKEFSYTKDYEVDREVKGQKQPRLLLISDSYGANIFPYIAEGFGRSVKIFDAWKYMLNEEIVEAEKPDVVILMIHEDRLPRLLSHQARLKRNI